MKDEQKVCQSEVEGEQFQHLEPMPNVAHSHCGICKCNYTTYYEHIASKEHISNTKSQQKYFRIIDDVFKDLL
jgi:hypothetical protein